MKYCTNCGRELLEGYIVCPSCGMRVANPQSNPQAPYAPQSLNPNGQSVNGGYGQQPQMPRNDIPVGEVPPYAPVERPQTQYQFQYQQVPPAQQSYQSYGQLPPQNNVSPVIAILALVFSFVESIAGLVLGIIGLTKYKNPTYRKMCIAAVIISSVLTVVGLIAAVAFGFLEGFLEVMYDLGDSTYYF